MLQLATFSSPAKVTVYTSINKKGDLCTLYVRRSFSWYEKKCIYDLYAVLDDYLSVKRTEMILLLFTNKDDIFHIKILRGNFLVICAD